MFNKKTPITLLGLDIRQPIRLVGIQPRSNDYLLTHYIEAKNFDSLNTLHINNIAIAMAIPEEETVSKLIQLDATLSERDIEVLLKISSTSYLNCTDEKLTFDFRILKDTSNQNGKQDVLVIAAKQDKIKAYLKPLENKFRISCLDIECYAIARCLKLLLEIKDNTYAVIMIESNELRLIIFHQNFCIFHYKANFTNNLLEVLKQSLQIFAINHHNMVIENYYLGGNYIDLITAKTLIAEMLQTAIIIANPFNKLKLDNAYTEMLTDKSGPGSLLSCGLALRGIADELS